MEYHGMPPEHHFQFMFNAKAEPSGRVRTRADQLLMTHRISYNDPVMDYPVQTEREIAITMGEQDYINFMKSYGNYLELVYNVENDPILKDMFEKMIMYMRLKY